MSGRKNDQQKFDVCLTPAAAELEEAFVWTFGKQKYDSYNWHNGIKYSRIISAIERHLKLLKSGIDFDYETKAHHAAAIRASCAMLIQFTLEGRTELDDRIKLDEETKSKIEKMSQGITVISLLTKKESIK
jgi:hypothetical protein